MSGKDRQAAREAIKAAEVRRMYANTPHIPKASRQVMRRVVLKQAKERIARDKLWTIKDRRQKPYVEIPV